MLENELLARGYKEVTARDVYSDLYHFGEGYIQQPGQLEPGLYQHFNPMIYGHNLKVTDSPDGKHKEKKLNQEFNIILDDNLDDVLLIFQDKDFAILDACGYRGMNYRKKLAYDKNGNRLNGKDPQIMFGFIMELDKVSDNNLIYLFDKLLRQPNRPPMPNYIACSGGGIHCYYVLDVPVRLQSLTMIDEMNFIKSTLSQKLWTHDTSGVKAPQIQKINQGYRLIGGKTKPMYINVRPYVRAFRIRPERYSLDEMKYYVSNDYISATKEDSKKQYEFLYHDWLGLDRLTLAEAKEKYPKWYQDRIVEHQKRKHYILNRAVYDSFLEKCKVFTQYGHRYNTVQALAITALQCGVTFEELKQDVLDLVPWLSSLNNDYPFYEQEALDAIEVYHDDKNYHVTNKTKEKMTLFKMKPCKRNGRTRKENLEIARVIKRQKNKDKNKEIVYQLLDKWVDGDSSIPQKILDRRYPRIVDIVSLTGLHRDTIRPIYSAWVKEHYKVTITTTRYTPSCEEERIIFDTLDKWYNKDKSLDDRYLNMPILTPSDIHSITSIDIEKCNQYFLKWYEMLSKQVKEIETMEKRSAMVPGGKELFWQALRDKATTGDPEQ